MKGDIDLDGIIKYRTYLIEATFDILSEVNILIGKFEANKEWSDSKRLEFDAIAASALSVIHRNALIIGNQCCLILEKCIKAIKEYFDSIR